MIHLHGGNFLSSALTCAMSGYLLEESPSFGSICSQALRSTINATCLTRYVTQCGDEMSWYARCVKQSQLHQHISYTGKYVFLLKSLVLFFGIFMQLDFGGFDSVGF